MQTNLKKIQRKTICMHAPRVPRNSLQAWLLAMRPKTLSGSAVPVMIATALALAMTNWNVRIVPVLLCFLFAFIMQIDANFINDYLDFKRGNDDETRLGPRRACAQGWISPQAMRMGIVVTTLLACVVGLPLVCYGGVEMVWVGFLCVLFCFLYTTHLSYLGLGDLLVLLFFGLIPVCVTYYLAMPSTMNHVTWEVVLSSLASGIIIDTLLIVNNYRDLENDWRAHKMTLVVRMGESLSRKVYLMLGWLGCLLGIVFLFNGHPWAFILPMIYLVLHTRTYRRMRIKQGKALNQILGETGRNIFIYGVLVSLGLLV